MCTVLIDIPSDTLRRHERSHGQPQNAEGEIEVVEGHNRQRTLAVAEADLTFQSSVSFSNPPATNHLPPLQSNILDDQSQNVAIINHDSLLTEGQISESDGNLLVQHSIQGDQGTYEHPNDLSPYSGMGLHSRNQLLDSDANSLELTFSGLSGSNISHDSWLLSSDFDIDAVSSALNDTLFEWAQALPASTLQQTQQESLSTQQGEHNETVRENRRQPMSNSENVESGVRFPSVDKWYARWQQEEATGLANPMSRVPSEDPDGELRIDEQYTATLSRHLRPRQYEETRLSVSYLNECLRLYFARFHPIFPVIHFPSFRPNSRNALLFLSMCSIGSLFVGSPSALSQGYHIYSRLNKAILASWETHLSETPQRSLSMVQAALIGQTFGLLSGKSNNLVMTDMFQGTLISWARKLGCFHRASCELPSENIEPAERTRAWKNWIRAEHLRRLLLALHIHDAELSSLLHHEPLLRHKSCQYAPTVNDALFEASSAEKWYNLFNSSRTQPTQASVVKFGDWVTSCSGPRATAPSIVTAIDVAMENSHLALYTMLENFNASIIESRQVGELDINQQDRFAQGLILWSKSFRSVTAGNKQDRLALRLLWHSCFMTLTTDLDSLERVLGRDGQLRATECLEEVANWAGSQNALRCLLHAIALQTLVEGMRMSWTPPIHVPRTLFSAGIAWICHRCWRRSQDGLINQQKAQLETAVYQFPEAHSDSWIERGHANELINLLCHRAGTHYEGTIYGIVELLQRLDRWAISNSFASILQEALSENIHE